ncbi:U6 snRNA phosphodiesterase 1 isoform X1 [Girardinichthys multiradiatus]|uniref:U6 snRNA phosphodiesterase 1 isoform X1 n=1 Tax=Girardinichthys multiradiatus TaxID=208333 RepID=UPI001FAC6210|nr:U6 snRNA phosphodiesterase 1 isoform X1 [Girardinichthys multiradiatus]
MLVGYSSSSEEDGELGGVSTTRASRRSVVEDEGNQDLPAKKKARTEGLDPKARLPLPGCLLSMFPDDDDDAQTGDSSLHGGRIRSFKHERGNWATYVYVLYPPEKEFEELLEELLSALGAHGLILTRQEEFHLSLSQTVVLRHHWIQPFTQSLQAGLSNCRRFVCSAATLKVYCNAERTRTFLGMEVSTGHAQLLDLVRAVDKTMTEFRLDTFYKDPSFHVSLAWCVGDQMEKMKEILHELQSLVDNHEEGTFLLRLPCADVCCRTGNKTFRFPLKP